MNASKWHDLTGTWCGQFETEIPQNMKGPCTVSQCHALNAYSQVVGCSWRNFLWSLPCDEKALWSRKRKAIPFLTGQSFLNENRKPSIFRLFESHETIRDEDKYLFSSYRHWTCQMENFNLIYVTNYPMQIQGIYHDLVRVELTEWILTMRLLDFCQLATEAAIHKDFYVILYGRQRIWSHHCSLKKIVV